MNGVYDALQWAVVTVAVAFAIWRVWKTYAPTRRAAKADEPGCEAGCPSCNQCTTTDNAPPPGVTPLPFRSSAEQPLHFHPRKR